VDLAVDKAAIKPTIYEHPQFAAFVSGMNAHFASWRQRSAATLKALKAGCHPKDVIAELSENLLAHYAGQPLINAYDVYQHLMDYWAETMQDDLYLIAVDGWKANTYIVREEKKNKEGKVIKTIDKGWACDLLPKPLIVARYFAAEQAAIDQLTADLDAIDAQLTELEEEHSGEDAVFSGFDKINKAAVKERLDELDGDREARDEIAVLKQWQKLDREKSALKKRLKDAEAALDDAAFAKYPKLSEAEIKALAVDDKWLGTLDSAIHGEMDRISLGLTRRVRELAERYEARLPLLVDRVAELQAKVDAHLERMGFAWR
jgi:type I restriction enzyme M protein